MSGPSTKRCGEGESGCGRPCGAAENPALGPWLSDWSFSMNVRDPLQVHQLLKGQCSPGADAGVGTAPRPGPGGKPGRACKLPLPPSSCRRGARDRPREKLLRPGAQSRRGRRPRSTQEAPAGAAAVRPQSTECGRLRLRKHVTNRRAVCARRQGPGEKCDVKGWGSERGNGDPADAQDSAPARRGLPCGLVPPESWVAGHRADRCG